MTRRLIDGFLLLVVLAGGLIAWQTGRERSRIMVDYERLVRATGDLPITDPSKVHILALETGEPLHFAWRVYLPAKYSLIQRNSSGNSGSSFSANPREFIARVRFREDDNGDLSLYQSFASGSSWGGFGQKGLTKILHGRFDRILVEQLGTPGIATFEPDASMVFLRLKLPPEMQIEVRETLNPFEQQRLIPIFFELSVGPDPKTPTSIGPGK